MIETAKKYAFALGREQEICLEELKSVLHHFGFYFDIYRISGNFVFAKIENFSREDASEIINVLGGTIKIYELVDSIANHIAKQLADLILEQKINTEGKINFGVSCLNKHFSRQQINALALTAKKKLKGKISLRFVEAKEGLELSSIQTLKNNLAGKGIEFGVFDEEIGILVALNNPESWNKRDYDKPAFDKYSGMVPPKLARAMVNIALGQVNLKFKISNLKSISNDKIINDNLIENCPEGHPKGEKLKIENCDDIVVVDPFCGSGNILMEALELGCDIIGSDMSERAVRDSNANVEWLVGEVKKSKIKNKNDNLKSKIFQADATSEEYIKELLSLDCQLLTCDKNIVFVTEPYLGEPKKFKTSFNATVGEYKKIYELYLAFLKNIQILSSSGLTRESSLDSRLRSSNHERMGSESNGGYDRSIVLCLIFPLVETVDHGQFSLYKECVDEIKKLGYTQVRPSMVYGREYQVVKREIVLLKLEQI